MELASAWKLEFQEYPDLQFKISDIINDIDNVKETATLHVECGLSGRVETSLMAVSQLVWRRKGDKAPWMYMSYLGMRNGFMEAGFQRKRVDLMSGVWLVLTTSSMLLSCRIITKLMRLRCIPVNSWPHQSIKLRLSPSLSWQHPSSAPRSC